MLCDMLNEMMDQIKEIELDNPGEIAFPDELRKIRVLLWAVSASDDFPDALVHAKILKLMSAIDTTAIEKALTKFADDAWKKAGKQRVKAMPWELDFMEQCEEADVLKFTLRIAK